MKSLSEICRRLAAGQIDLTQHAATRIVERNISKQEIQDAGREATIIEDYPDDKICAKLFAARIYKATSPASHSCLSHEYRTCQDYYALRTR